jgi:hypothetical protein
MAGEKTQSLEIRLYRQWFRLRNSLERRDENA